jgi:homocysteine S-methyltransferase
MTQRVMEELGERTFLTSGGTETYLLFGLGFPLRDACAFEVFEDDDTWEKLERTYLAPIAAAALASGHGLLYDVLAWRASPDWFTRLGYTAADFVRFNALAVERTVSALDSWRAGAGEPARDLPILISADVGPRGDGYRVDAASATPADALAYHRQQIAILSQTGVDVVQAMTMTHANEAIGIALAAREHSLPVIMSPTVETDGRLPDGSTLDELIRRVDDATDGWPLYYMVNCAHPTHLMPTLRAARAQGAGWLSRFAGFRANASAKSHQELDNSPTLDIGDPADLASRVSEMQREFGLRIVGGCCGTDARHIAAIARATASRGPV